MVAMVSAVSSVSGATRYYKRDGYYAKYDPEHQTRKCLLQRLKLDSGK